MKYCKYKVNLVLMAEKYVYAKNSREAKNLVEKEYKKEYENIGLNIIGSNAAWTGEVTEDDCIIESFNKEI